MRAKVPREKRVPPIAGPGRRAPGGRALECYSCGRSCREADVAGAYCPTCRGRGAENGWCGCGAALYADGLCPRGGRHPKGAPLAATARRRGARA